MSDDTQPTFMLCDYAEVMNGKLYVMGGGLDNVFIPPGGGVALALGILLHVPWQETNRPQKLHIVLVTEDGDAVPAGPEQEPLVIDGQVEVGRPPGTVAGYSFPVPVGIRLPPLVLSPGRFRFELHLNGAIEATTPFRVTQQG
jgi:hypothetical protein